MEHLHHFQLSEDPFRVDAPEKFDVALETQREALARLDRGVRQNKGLVLLIGGVGAGKTTVARRLYESLEDEVFEASMMVVLRREVGTDWLLSRFARELGVESPQAEREALIGQIYERLAIVHEDGRRAVLIIDDAQGLANEDTLAEVCALVKLEYEDRRLLTIVLVGASPLDAAIRRDALLAHHVDVRVAVPELTRDEAAHYVTTRIQTAGGDAQLVLPGACAALHEMADGAPGRINVLADNALFEAWLAQRSEVTRNDVERAWRSLGWDAVAVPGNQAQAAGVEPTPGRSVRSSSATAQAERTMMDFSAPEGSLPVLDLGDELDSDIESAESPATQIMDFDAPSDGTAASGPLAEATRVELRDAALDGPPKDAEDEVDDLFMELLDD